MPASRRSTGPAAPATGAAELAVSMTSRPCDIAASPTGAFSGKVHTGFPQKMRPIMDSGSGDVDLLGQLQQLGGERRLGGVVLPRRRARNRPPLLDDGVVEIVHRCAHLGVDLRHLLVVG